MASDPAIEMGVKEAEKLLIEGDFRAALKEANRCLSFQQQQRQSNSPQPRPTTFTDDDVLVVPLQIPLKQGRSYRLMVTCKPVSASLTLTDRAGAVALQSWYELFSQATSETERQRGDVHLEPFFQTYATSSSGIPCPLELTVILLQFLKQINHTHQAIEIGSTILHFIFSNSDDQVHHEWQDTSTLQELVNLVFLTIPYCPDATMVQSLLRRFHQLEFVPMDPQKQWKIVPTPQRHASATRQCLTFVENPPLHWHDEWGVLRVCQQQLLQWVDSLTSQDEEKLAVVPMTPSGRSSLPTLGWDGSSEQWIRRAIHLVKVMVIDPLLESNWETRGKAAITVWSVWTAWKQRRRLYRLGNTTLWMLWAPVQEIVDAILLMGR